MNCHHRRCDRHFNEFQDYSGSAAIPVTLAKIENTADTKTDSHDETHCNHDDPPDHESALQGSPTEIRLAGPPTAQARDAVHHDLLKSAS
jgi:hypothetical protein